MKVTKTNSYTVSYLSQHGDLAVGFIVTFMKVVLTTQDEPYYLAALRNLHERPNDGHFSDVKNMTNSKELGVHLKSYQYEK